MIIVLNIQSVKERQRQSKTQKDKTRQDKTFDYAFPKNKTIDDGLYFGLCALSNENKLKGTDLSLY